MELLTPDRTFISNLLIIIALLGFSLVDEEGFGEHAVSQIAPDAGAKRNRMHDDLLSTDRIPQGSFCLLALA